MSNKVSIVIINKNGEKFLKRLFRTLINSCSGCLCEIIIVDNASTDKSIDIINEIYKDLNTSKHHLKIVRLKRNAGFCYAVNVGVAFSTSQLVAILNSDLYVDDGWLIPILKIFESSSRIGVVQPLICWYQYPEKVQSTGLYADVIGNYKGNQFNSKAILAPFGAAYVVRRSAFMRIGGLDPIYFMYGDELDLGLRMWLAGYMVILEPSARVYHYMGGVTPSSTYFKTLKYFLMRRNQVITLIKSLSLKHLLVVSLILAKYNIIRGIISREKLRAILAAYMNIAHNACYIITKRRLYLKIKVLSEDKLRRWGLLRPLM